MALAGYYWRWLKKAFSFRRSFAVADGLAGAISIISPAIILWLVPEPSSADVSQVITDLAWQIPLGVLGALTLGRLALAPYWMHQEKHQKLNQAESERQQLQAELIQAIGDDVSVAIARLSYMRVQANEMDMNGPQVFNTLAPQFITGNDIMVAHHMLSKQWPGLDLTHFNPFLTQMLFIGVLDSEHHGRILHVTELGKRVYIKLQDNIFN